MPTAEGISKAKNWTAIFISENASISAHLTESDEYNKIRSDDLIWSLCRMKVTETMDHVLDKNEFQAIPGWSTYNSILVHDPRPKQVIEFLSIFSHPVTEFATVYTSLGNFINFSGKEGCLVDAC